MAKAQKSISTAQKILELEASVNLYIYENIKLQKEMVELKKKLTMQSAEVVAFVDRVKAEKAETEAFILRLETNLNEAWGFIQDLKDVAGDDLLIRGLLQKHFEEDSSPGAYSH